MPIVWWVLASVICGILYRLGGIGRPFNTKHRDLGCPTAVWLVNLYLLDIKGEWWVHLICFLLLFAALTTYWDSLFGFDNFWFHGFMCGLAHVPMAFIDGHWFLWPLRAIIMGALIGGWSLLIGNDVAEEFGRGFLIVATLLILAF